jgi:TRAP-type mannitol/chloroaromatic compound transport system permease small subunit
MLEYLQRLARALDGLAELTGRALSWLTLVMVLVTFVVVVLRYAFDAGSIALQESVTYLHAAVFMLGAAYTLKHDAHVRVDIFYQRWSPRTRAWIDLLGTLLLLMPVCSFILLASLDYVSVSWSILEGSREAGGLDGVYLLKTAIPLMAVLLLLQGIALAIHSLLVLAGYSRTPAPDTGVDREL